MENIMEKIAGKIEKVESSTGTGNKGAWERFVFHINDKKYSTFDKDIAKKFGVGMDVVMSGVQDGAFWNMKTMEMDLDIKPTAQNTEKPKERTTTSRATPRTSVDITATELIRYAVKLHESSENKEFSTSCRNILDEYNNFKEKLNNGA